MNAVTGDDDLTVRLNRYRTSIIAQYSNRSDNFARAVKCRIQRTVWIVADNQKVHRPHYVPATTILPSA